MVSLNCLRLCGQFDMQQVFCSGNGGAISKTAWDCCLDSYHLCSFPLQNISSIYRTDIGSFWQRLWGKCLALDIGTSAFFLHSS